MKKTKKLYTADNLWILANEIIDSQITDDDIRKEDRTELFYYELEKRVENGELININLNGRTRDGKSTAGQALMVVIKDFIKTHHKLNRPPSNANILRDQNEYARTVKARPESFKHECDVIDEWNEMENSGYNSTLLDKYLKQFSDVQAGRYYHRIACSPKDTTDENADILLQVVPSARTHGKTPCLLYYRMHRGDVTQPVLLGYIVIDVSFVLTAPWYKEYLIKKEEKWSLMNKHNVKSTRELEYSIIILNTFNRLKKIAQYQKLQRDHIKHFFQDEADKQGVWFSILGDKDILETINGMLDLQTSIAGLKEKKIRLIAKKVPVAVILAQDEMIQEFKKRLGEMLHRQDELRRLWDQYKHIDDKGGQENVV